MNIWKINHSLFIALCSPILQFCKIFRQIQNARQGRVRQNFQRHIHFRLLPHLDPGHLLQCRERPVLLLVQHQGPLQHRAPPDQQQTGPDPDNCGGWTATDDQEISIRTFLSNKRTQQNFSQDTKEQSKCNNFVQLREHLNFNKLSSYDNNFMIHTHFCQKIKYPLVTN